MYLWRWLVPRRGDGSQYRHQLAATTKAILRISFTWTLVNAQFWSTQWSTQTFSHTWPHLHGPPPVATYIYIYRPLHRLGSDNGNHYQLPSLAFAWVTDMPTCNASQTCRVWRLQSLWRGLVTPWVTMGQSHSKEPVRGRYAATKKRTGHHRWST